MDGLVDAFRDNEDLALAVMLPAAQADMAGQLMVQDVEAGTGLKLARGAPEYTFRLDGTNFMSMPWPEAVEAFKRRGLVSDTELSQLLDGYRERSADARQLLLEHLRKRVNDELLRVLEEGGSFAEFAEAIRLEQETFGVGGANIGYLETVFRTNIQTAYGAGRFRAMNHPDVVEARPLWQCRSVQDDRVVPNPCRVLAGKIFRVGNPVTDPLYPPNHFNFRCAAVSLAQEDLEGRRVWTEVPPGGQPAAGFDLSPISLVEQRLA